MFQQSPTAVKPFLFAATLILFGISILAGLELWNGLHQVMVHVFLVFGFVLIVRHIILLYAAWQRNKELPTEQSIHNAQSAHGFNSANGYPSISIIIPAYNEESVIQQSLSSLLQLDYPDYEVIMVDDGSSDNTVGIAQNILKKHQLSQNSTSLRILTQTNAGKSSALNTGLRHAQGELVLCVDSDSRLASDSLKWGVEHFKDPRVAAVAGHVEVANSNHWLTRFQQLEYLISQNFVRRGLSWFGIVTVIPGPVGLFKRQVIEEVGGYSEDENLFAEDADLTVRFLTKGYRIVSEDRMMASTEAPVEIYPLLRQRYRWKRGIYQTLHLNFKELILANQSRQSFIAVFLVLEGFFMEVMSFAITLFILASFFRFAELKLLYAWFGLLFILDVLVLMLAVGKGWWKAIPLLFMQKLVYGYALQGWGVFSLLDEWRSSKMSWDKVERVGGLS